MEEGHEGSVDSEGPLETVGCLQCYRLLAQSKNRPCEGGASEEGRS